MERRVRTAWLVRRRFYLAPNVGSAVGTLLAFVTIVRATRATDPTWQSSRFLAGATGTILLGTAVPRLAILMAWRVARSRNHENWE